MKRCESLSCEVGGGVTNICRSPKRHPGIPAGPHSRSASTKGRHDPSRLSGGTALRFLYATARYSEDLDFSLEGNAERYDFRSYLGAISKEFVAEGYEVQVKLSDKKVVNSAFVRFPGLPYELGLSPHSRQTLSVNSRWTLGLQWGLYSPQQ